jgi:hypothetical protein
MKLAPRIRAHLRRIMKHTAVRPHTPSYLLTGPEGPRIQT